MPHYLVQAAYTPEAWATLVKNPQDRIKAIAPAIERLGGKVQDGYLAFGEYDIVVVCEFPDNVTAAAFSAAASAGGSVKAFKTTPLMTMADAVKAMKKAGASNYEPPG
ncbi:MAG: GYD domain-containing protein [Actinobacteria bacterium]|jgi:uncharacterized protein with GYD domain|nr:MAG: GYD domain-containing protein [Actinomycetota bacterium]